MRRARKKRKICFVITSGIHYARNQLLLAELKKQESIDLKIIIGGSALLTDYYGDILPALLKKDGFKSDAEILMTIEGGNSLAMAKTTGVGIIEFASVFERMRPDIVVVRGDRYEVLSATIAAAYLNISVAHIEGGDLTGTIDESVRHAITKLAHIHFATNDVSRRRIIQMGENPKYVFNVGSPEVEMLVRANYKVSGKLINYLGVGSMINVRKPYLIVMYHAVTSETSDNRGNVEKVLRAVNDVGVPTIWFWPNNDAGTDSVARGIRSFREVYNPVHIRFIKYLPNNQFLGLLRKAACLVGNSSAGFKECSFYGVPVVNIGTRQDGRTRTENIVDVGYDKEEIKRAIHKQLEKERYKENRYYYKKGTAKKITRILSTIHLYNQKRFYEYHLLERVK